MPSLNNVQVLGLIFKEYGRYLRLNGRRLQNLHIQKTWKLYIPDPHNMSRYVAMAPRKLRRQRAKELGVNFKPVIGFVGPLSKN